MRRLFIIRKDLGLSSGKLAAMVAHCAEGFWTRLISSHAVKDGESYKVDFCLDANTMEDYVRGLFVKTICEAKNLHHLMKVEQIANELGLVRGTDYDYIDDACLTELTPDCEDSETGRKFCRVGIWFRPLDDETSHKLSKKYQLFKDRQ